MFPVRPEGAAVSMRAQASPNPHLASPVMRWGAPPARARLAVLLVHGRGQSAAWIRAEVADRLALDDLAWAAPEAHGGSWYPERFLAPVEMNEPRLSQALERIERLSSEIASQGVPVERQVLVGFSQGACLLGEHAWRSRLRYGALSMLTGALIGPPSAPRPACAGALDGLPVLLSSGEDDPHVSAASVAQTGDRLRAAGAHVEQAWWPDGEHRVRDGEIERLRRLLTAVGRSERDS